MEREKNYTGALIRDKMIVGRCGEENRHDGGHDNVNSDNDSIAKSGDPFKKDEMTSVIWVVMSKAWLEEFSVCDLEGSDKTRHWREDWLKIWRSGWWST
ncbi:Hypothetical predicted protein [Olea europaea subsp. europaea]|uniref:Uncharacterized protein n=1 Tax=Olea europaea subsp. europaea TaxID=158383 RepID=A0A8S0R081_OLEEU|nr:Hypothetical predicted protein [Olea europaea subsp. europaea]